MRAGVRRSAESKVDRVSEVIRADIISGSLPPGSALRLRQLGDRYDAGYTPVREALISLTASGLVELSGFKGFRVAPVSNYDLEDITRLRIALEGLALRESIKMGDDRWEASIVGAFHVLEKTVSRVGENVDEKWEVANRDFHAALLSACQSERLLTMCQSLQILAARYRNLSLTSHVCSRDEQAEHREIMQTVLRRDADAACEALASHYQLTADIVKATLRNS